MLVSMVTQRRCSRRAGWFAGLSAAALASAHAPVFAQDAQPGETDLRAGAVPVPPPPANAALPPVDEIISDDEFNRTVPSLDVDADPDLDAPLESIADFERRIAADQADADPAEGAAPPLGQPALADGDAVEEIGDAPVRDAELAAPLPPLDQFQVEPVEFAQDETDPGKVEVAYSVQLNGLDEADKETEAAIRGEFNALSALRDGDGKAANGSQVAARLTEDSVLIQRILASEGWFSPQVATRIEQPAEAGGALQAVIDVTPGQRYTFSQIVLDAGPTVPPDLISGALALKPGEPIVAERVQGAEANIAVTLPQSGYPFAEVGQRDILLDPATGTGDYTLPVTTGPRAKFGGFAVTGEPAFGADHVEVLARFERGELYDSRMVDDLRKALVATGLFNTVTVQPQRTNEPAGDGTEYVTMVVDQQAGPPRTIAATAGYGTGEGFRAEATWTHRNLFPPEGALIAHGVAGTKEQGAGLTFRRSNAGKRDRVFEVVAEALHSNYEAFSAYTGRLAARIARDSTPIWQKRYTYAFGAQLIGTAEKDYDFDLGESRRRTFFIGGLTGQVGFDTSNDLLDPTQGFRVILLAEPEGSFEDGFNPYVRARIDGTAYFSPSDSLVLAGRVRLGTIQGADRVDIAPSRRFYSGGGGSVRGFGYQKLGPLDPDGKPLGGRSLNEAAAEVRYRFGNYGVVGFVDVGQSYEATMPKFSDLRIGAGIGGRFYTNFGPLRVDVATPINRRPGEGRINVYVSIGQAF